ncbi:MAG: acyltransferase domain-containing protein, partial [Candidatus Hydrogenedentes bacterium]|nr:acyltransferase domain-containing protein [Candidatus Hydrogenedentota bacterium]
MSDLNTRLNAENPQTNWTLPKGAAYGYGPADGSLAMVFPGQGAQYAGMLRDLSCLFPEMLDALEIGNRTVRFEDEPVRLSDRIYPHPAFDKETATRDEAVLKTTDTAQPAIGAMSLGLLKVFQRFGVTPSMVAGHSYGELTALHAAGVFDEKTLLSISHRRGSLMGQQGDDKGSMLAVRASSDAIDEVLRAESLDLVVANKNTPAQSVLSGATAEIVRAQVAFKKQDITCTQLSVAAAFHSAFVSDAEAPFLEYLNEVPFASPRIPVYSNSTAKPYPNDAGETRSLLASQLARPVAFVDEIESMYAAGARTFVEVGPGARVTGMVRAILEGRPHCAVSADASAGKRSGLTDLATCLIRIAAAGHAIDLTPWGIMMDPVEAPSEKPKMTITISGANYRSPQAKPSVSTMAKPKISTIAKQGVSPMPKSTAPQTSRTVTTMEGPPVLPIVTPAATPTLDTAPPTPAPKVRAPQPPVSAAKMTVDTRPPVAPTPSVPQASTEQQGALAEILRQTQANIAALQQMQERTARLHSQFLEGQQSAAQTYQTLLHQQHQLMTSAPQTTAATPSAPSSSPPSPEPVPAPVQPVATGTPVTSPVPPGPETASPDTSAVADAPRTEHLERVLLEVIAEKTGYPSEMLETTMSLDADLGIDSIKRVEILSALQERISDLPTLESDQLGAIQTIGDILAHFASQMPEGSRDLSTPAAEQGGQPIEDALIEVVAEKTGYPPDMLEMTMNMDSDLGIDSIKRVEILSALQDRFPGLPTVASEDLGKLQTLQDVVDTLHSANVSSVTPAPATKDSEDLSSILLAIVAEKTGYPPDMLELDMSLDGDLGIDSIKRVEILSVLQDRVPTLPSVEPEELGKLQTLNDIIQRLTEQTHPIVPLTDAPLPRAEGSGGNGAVPALTKHSITRSLLEAVPFQEDAARPVVALREDAVIWVTDDGASLSQAIVERLHFLGFDATLADIRKHDFESMP